MIHRAFRRCLGVFHTTALAALLAAPTFTQAADAGEPPVTPAVPAAGEAPLAPVTAPLPMPPAPPPGLPVLPNPRNDEFNPENSVAARATRGGLNTPYAVDAWSAETIIHERLVRSTGSVFNEAPASAVQSAGPGGDTPNVRGFTGPRNLLLIDDIRVNNSVVGEGPGLLWSSLDPFNVARLETVRSPSSVLYGSDAVGSATGASLRSSNDFSRDGLLRPLYVHLATRLSAAENSNAEHGEVGYVKDNWQFLFAAGYKHFGDIQSPGSPGLQTGTEFEQHDFLAKGAVQLTRRDRMEFAFNHDELINAPNTNQTGAGKPWKQSTTGTDIYNRSNFFRDLAYARYIADDEASALERLVFTASLSQVRMETDRKTATFEHINQGFSVLTPGFAAAFSGKPFAMGPALLGRLSGGAEYYTDHVDSFLRDYTAAGAVNEIGLQGMVADNADYSRFGIYLQFEQWLREEFNLTAGVRFSSASADLGRIDSDARAGSSFQTLGSLHDNWQNVCFNLRALHRCTEYNSVYAAFSESFRMPNLVDLSNLTDLGGLGREVPGQHTRPEQFFTFEIGNRLATPHLTGQAALFYTHMADLLELASVGGGLFEARNAGYGDVYGFEMEATWDVYSSVRREALRGVSVFGNFTWQQGFARQFDAQDGKHYRQWLTNMPPTMLSLGARYDVPGHACFAELVTRYADVQDRLSTTDRLNTAAVPPGGTPSYFIVTVRGGGKMMVRGVPVRASLAIENLFNKNYRVHGSGTNEPGANFIATVEADL